MNYAGKQLACDLIHIRDHKKKSLRSSIGRSKSAGRQRTVNSSGSSRFGLHFSNLYGRAEDICLTLCRPLVCNLSHY